MSVNAWVMLGILSLMFAFLVWDRFPAWLVFMGTLTAAMTLKLASAEALLAGFAIRRDDGWPRCSPWLPACMPRAPYLSCPSDLSAGQLRNLCTA